MLTYTVRLTILATFMRTVRRTEDARVVRPSPPSASRDLSPPDVEIRPVRFPAPPPPPWHPPQHFLSLGLSRSWTPRAQARGILQRPPIGVRPVPLASFLVPQCLCPGGARRCPL